MILTTNMKYATITQKHWWHSDAQLHQTLPWGPQGCQQSVVPLRQENYIQHSSVMGIQLEDEGGGGVRFHVPAAVVEGETAVVVVVIVVEMKRRKGRGNKGD